MLTKLTLQDDVRAFLEVFDLGSLPYRRSPEDLPGANMQCRPVHYPTLKAAIIGCQLLENHQNQCQPCLRGRPVYRGILRHLISTADSVTPEDTRDIWPVNALTEMPPCPQLPQAPVHPATGSRCVPTRRLTPTASPA